MHRVSGTIRRIGGHARRILALVLPLSVFSLTACTDFGTNIRLTDPGGMSVLAGEHGIDAENKSTTRMHLFVVSQDIASLIDWAPICSEENAIEVGRRVDVPYDRIIGYEKGCIVVVYWWHPVRVSGGTAKPDSIRIIHLKTP